MRPTWDETWMGVAHVIAQRSPCSRAKVGCVIVDTSNRVVATGYNGPPAGYRRLWRDECDGRENTGACVRGFQGPTDATLTSYVDCPSLHAEANALSFCDRRHREGGTIYVTGITCFNCAKLVANSGLARLVVQHEVDREYRDPDTAYALLRECYIEIETIKADEQT